MDKKKIIYGVLVSAGFAIFFAAGVWLGQMGNLPYCKSVAQPGTINFSAFWDAYNKLKENFIDPSKIKDQQVIYGAINGMTQSLGDPYTEFFNPDQAKLFNQDLQGSFDGIGVEVGMKNGQLTVIAPLPNNPGQKAGLKSGDEIIKINGKDSSNFTTDQAVNLIRGQKGTSVTLTIFRDGWDATKDFKITRDTIKVPSTKLSFLDNGNVAYVQIFQFDQTLPTDFSVEANQILKSKAKKIIVDLRDDPGGYLDAAQNVAGWFLQNGQTVTIEDFGSGKEQKIYKSEGNGSLSGYPTVVLINQGSASAAEILSGALRDNRNVKLIGTKSFGKGSVQEVIDMSDGSFIKITIAKWLTPKGKSISEVGLMPDVKVDLTEQNAKDNKDPQLDKALEIIKGLN